MRGQNVSDWGEFPLLPMFSGATAGESGPEGDGEGPGVRIISGVANWPKSSVGVGAKEISKLLVSLCMESLGDLSLLIGGSVL